MMQTPLLLLSASGASFRAKITDLQGTYEGHQWRFMTMRVPLILASTALALSVASPTVAAQQQSFPTISEYLSSSGGDDRVYQSDHSDRFGSDGYGNNIRAQGSDPLVKDLLNRVVQLEQIISSLHASAQGDSGIDVEDLINARIEAIDYELSGMLARMANHYDDRIDKMNSSGAVNRGQGMLPQSKPAYTPSAATQPQSHPGFYSASGNTASKERILTRSRINLSGKDCEMTKRIDSSGHVVSEVSCQSQN